MPIRKRLIGENGLMASFVALPNVAKYCRHRRLKRHDLIGGKPADWLAAGFGAADFFAASWACTGACAARTKSAEAKSTVSRRMDFTGRPSVRVWMGGMLAQFERNWREIN